MWHSLRVSYGQNFVVQHLSTDSQQERTAMNSVLNRPTALNRRALLRGGAAGMALALANFPLSAFADPAAGEELLPFLDQPPVVPGHVSWLSQPEWLTAPKDTFAISHYGQPKLDA